MHRDQHRRAPALGVGRAHRVTGSLRRDHHHVEILARHDLSVVDVEPVGESERRALSDTGFDVGFVHGGDMLIRHQHHHEVGSFDRPRNLLDVQAGLFCLVPGGAVLSQSDRDFHSRVVQVQGMGMSLRPVTHDRDLPALHEGQVRVLVVIDFHAVSFWFCRGLRPSRPSPRARCPKRRFAPSPGWRCARAPE